jgi:hypothetical protein
MRAPAREGPRAEQANPVPTPVAVFLDGGGMPPPVEAAVSLAPAVRWPPSTAGKPAPDVMVTPGLPPRKRRLHRNRGRGEG